MAPSMDSYSMSQRAPGHAGTLGESTRQLAIVLEFSYNRSVRSPDAVDGMVRWMALTVLGIALFLVLPRELLGTKPVPVGALRIAPSALVGLAVMLSGWLYAIGLVVRSLRTWRHDRICTGWAVAFLVLPPVALLLGALNVVPGALLLASGASAAFVVWALRVDALFAMPTEEPASRRRLTSWLHDR